MSTIRELMKLSSNSKDLEKLVHENETLTDPHTMLVDKVNRLNGSSTSGTMISTDVITVQKEKSNENVKTIENKELPTLKELHKEVINKDENSELAELITQIQNNDSTVPFNTTKESTNEKKEWKTYDRSSIDKMIEFHNKDSSVIVNENNNEDCENPEEKSGKPTREGTKGTLTEKEQITVTKDEQHKEMEIEPVSKRLRKNIKKVEHEVIDTQISRDSEDGDSIGSEDTYSDDTSDSEDTYNYNDGFINDDTISTYESNENSMSETYESGDTSTTREHSEEKDENDTNDNDINENNISEEGMIIEPVNSERNTNKNKLQRIIANTMKNKVMQRRRFLKKNHLIKHKNRNVIDIDDEHNDDKHIDVDALEENEVNEISSESDEVLNNDFIDIDDIELGNDSLEEEWNEKEIPMRKAIRSLKDDRNKRTEQEKNDTRHEHGKIIIKRREENGNECQGINKYLRLGSVLNTNFRKQNDLRQFNELECTELNKPVSMNKRNTPCDVYDNSQQISSQNERIDEYDEKYSKEKNDKETCKELEEKISMMQNLLQEKRRKNSEKRNTSDEKKIRESKPKHSTKNKERVEKKSKEKKVVGLKMDYRDFQPESDDGIDFRNFLHNVHVKRNQIINKICVWLNDELNKETEIKESDIIAYLQIKNKINDEHYDI